MKIQVSVSVFSGSAGLVSEVLGWASVHTELLRVHHVAHLVLLAADQRVPRVASHQRVVNCRVRVEDHYLLEAGPHVVANDVAPEALGQFHELQVDRNIWFCRIQAAILIACSRFLLIPNKT